MNSTIAEAEESRACAPQKAARVRVLVATDFSDKSSRAICAAYRLAESANGELLLLHVSLPLTHHDLGINSRESQLRANNLQHWAETKMSNQLRETIETDAEVPVKTKICEGFAYDCIVREAELYGADFLVIARHGHSDDQTAIIGPTAESVLKHARCPVVLVR